MYRKVRMANANFNISSKQIAQLKEAFKSVGKNELEASKFTGNAKSIFNSLNEEYDNAFKDTGMKAMLNSIAGADGEISEKEIKAFMNNDGDGILSMDDFISYATNAIEDSIKDFDLEEGKDTTVTNYKSGDVKVQVAQRNEKGEMVKASQIREDGTKYEFTFNPDGTKKSQLATKPDGTTIYKEFQYDENGNKISSTSKKCDANGNLQSTSESKYDEQGRKTYGKTVDANGNLRGEANYKYQDNGDGTSSQLRYDMSGNLTNTTIYKDSVKNPIKKTNHITNTVETFTKKADGTQSSVVKSADGKNAEDNQYDEEGNVISKIIYNEFGDKTAEITYTYYDNGELKNTETKEFEVPEHKEQTSNTPKTEQQKPTTNTKALTKNNNPVNSFKDATAPNTYYPNGGLKTKPYTNADGQYCLGLSPDKLAEYASKVGVQRGTHDRCLGGVNDTLNAAYGFSFGHGSAYQADADLANNAGFTNITSKYSTPESLANLPAGAIVVWDKSDNYPHGHISIALGDGREASDCFRTQIKHLGTSSFHVYMPNS